MYLLKTEIYKPKLSSVKFVTEFDNYKDAVIAAEHTVKVLDNIMSLTRHPSCESSVNHCGYYADLYNELAVIVEKKKDTNGKIQN
jgi:hypothetical protein